MREGVGAEQRVRRIIDKLVRRRQLLLNRKLIIVCLYS